MHYIYALTYNAYIIFKHAYAYTHVCVCTDYIYVYVNKNVCFYIIIVKRVLALVEDLCPYQLGHVLSVWLGTRGDGESERVRVRLGFEAQSHQLVSYFISVCLSSPHL